MAIPNKAVGYGQTTATNVFRVTFSTALSAQPRIEAWDGGTYPAVGSASTVANDIFVGTAGNGNRSMLGCAATTSAGPGAAGWMPTNATAGGATINRLKGSTNFVVDPTTPGAGGRIKFNLSLAVPSDTPVSATMAHDILIRFNYTGATPALTWEFNDAVSGTEGTPTWTAWTPGTSGITHTRAGTVAGGPYIANVPVSGIEYTGEGWVTN